MSECPISANPVRIIPFDLGRTLSSTDISLIEARFFPEFRRLALTSRQRSILKGALLAFQVSNHVSAYLYATGINVIVVKENEIDFQNNLEHFSISYGENRKKRTLHSSNGSMTHIALQHYCIGGVCEKVK